MKKIYLLLILLFPVLLASQTMRRYVLVEHITNTNCPICSTHDPNINSALAKFPDDIHSISIHPSVPYPDCALYQFNTVDNGAREDYYGILGTPQVFIDGESTSRSASVIEQDISSALTNGAGIQIKVEENSGSQRIVNVTIASEMDYPDATYKLFVAIVERNVAYEGRNGIPEHYNVLRDFLTAPDGDDIELPAAGEQLNLTFETEIDGAIVLGEAYTLVYIQNEGTREVLNSGTMADGTTISSRDYAIQSGLDTYPNPVEDALRISVDLQYKVNRYEIFNSLGQIVQQADLQNPVSQWDINTSQLPKGSYWLKVSLNEGFSGSRFIKQ